MWFESSLRSEQGKDSINNEDYCHVDAKKGLFVVADGMGGRPGGKLASKTAVTAFVAQIGRLAGPARLQEDTIHSAIATVNEQVRALSQANPDMTGAGTTLTSFIVHENQGRTVHVGDSRVYLFRDNYLKQLTTDHTLVSELLERNHLSAEKAEHYPYRHVLSRSVGANETVKPDIGKLTIVAGDWFLLMTDGLSEVLDNESIEQLIQANCRESAQKMCCVLVETVMKHQMYDDLTVIAIHIHEEVP